MFTCVYTILAWPHPLTTLPCNFKVAAQIFFLFFLQGFTSNSGSALLKCSGPLPFGVSSPTADFSLFDAIQKRLRKSKTSSARRGLHSTFNFSYVSAQQPPAIQLQLQRKSLLRQVITIPSPALRGKHFIYWSLESSIKKQAGTGGWSFSCFFFISKLVITRWLHAVVDCNQSY